MNEKLFWWAAPDGSAESAPLLWYVDAGGFAVPEYDPQYGPFSIEKLLSLGYVEISWKSARAMGAPYR